MDQLLSHLEIQENSASSLFCLFFMGGRFWIDLIWENCFLQSCLDKHSRHILLAYIIIILKFVLRIRNQFILNIKTKAENRLFLQKQILLEFICIEE